jgi:hypothetical protein
VLHTLAAAEWLSGLRTDAIATQEHAVAIAPAELAPRFADQLARYRSAAAR